MALFNESKEQRARQVIANPNKFDVEGVERKALTLATAEGLKGEELVVRVYEIMGGKVGTDVEVKKSKEAEKNVGKKK